MIGSKRICKQTLATLLNGQRLPALQSLRQATPVKLLTFTNRSFADSPKDSGKDYAFTPAAKTGYSRNIKGLQEHFDKKDPYYDPYHPYVWIQVLPRCLQPYLRFTRVDQQFGRMLVTNPHLWGIAIASPLGCPPDLVNLALFMGGSVLAHPGGCAFDDIIDVPVDRTNERTALRPLVAKTMSTLSGYLVSGSLCAGAFGILSMLSPVAINLGLMMTPFIMIYPFMKRFFQYPQVFLSLGLNLGVFMGFGAVTNAIYWPVCLPLYIAGIVYTISYDSIYAFQDVEADNKAGSYSVSQKFLSHARAINATLTGTAIGLHTLAGYMAGLHPIFLPILAAGASHQAWIAWKLDPKNAPLCDHLLNISYRYGVFVLLAYIAGAYFADGKKKKVEAEIKKRNAQIEKAEAEMQ